MTRRHNQQKIDKVSPQCAEDFTEDLFFASVCAATENDRPLFQSESGESLTRDLWIHSHVLGVIFDATDVTKPGFFHPECFPFLNVLGILNPNPIKQPKSRRDETTKCAKQSFRARR